MFVLPAILAVFLAGSGPQEKQVPPAQIPVQQQEPRIVEGIVIRGNRRIPSDNIQYNIRTKTRDVLDRDVLRADIRRLYSLGYFDDITVYEENTRTGVTLTFEVKEKPIIRSIDYKGLRSYTRSEVLDRFRDKKVGLDLESPYDPSRIRKAEAVLKELLSEKGHEDATVGAESKDVPPNAVDLTFNVVEGPEIRIGKIQFEGNRVFSGRTIRNSMTLQKQAGPISSMLGKDRYNKLKLTDDLTRVRLVYDEHGYVRLNIHEPEVAVRPATIHRTFPLIKPPFPWGIPIPFWQKSLDRYFITIGLDENDRYRVGTFQIAGARLFTEEKVRSVLRIREGDVFNGTQIRKGFEDLKKLYGAQGYVNYAPVPTQDFDEQNKRINLTVNIDEGHQYFLHRLNFMGNTMTHDRVIRREIKIDEGGIFNTQLWEQSILRLNQLAYFEPIRAEDTEIKPATQEDNVDVTLKVREKNRNVISFTGGISQIGGSFLGMSYQTNNFLGLGETFQVTLQGGTRYSNYLIGFTEPYFKDRPITVGGQIFLSKLEFEQIVPVTGINTSQLPPGLGLTDTLNFSEQRAGFTAYTSYPWRLWNRAGLNFTWEDTRATAINPATQDYFSTVIVQQQSGFISASGGFNTLHNRKLIPTYTFNTTDNPTSPHQGQVFSAALEFTGGFLGGNVNYVRPTFEYRYFHPVNKNRNTLAFRFLSSYIRPFHNGAIPFYDRFFLGGDFDIRGFDFRSISPIASIIRQLPVTDPVTGITSLQSFDDIVYVGGDTQGVFNFEYRIPLAGPLAMAPYFDIGSTWATQLSQLVRNVVDSEGNTVQQGPQFLAGTNTSLRSSTGVEFQVLVPIINAPFRLIFDYNPLRIDRQYFGIANGLPFQIKDPVKNVKFSVGRTF